MECPTTDNGQLTTDVSIMNMQTTQKNSVKDIIISFIVPTLNVEGYLPACLEAIKKQKVSEGEFEIIVVDNGSTDRTVEIARDSGAEVYIVPKKTVAALRNIGAAEAKGVFLAYVDADCVICDHWLQNGLRHFDDSKVAAAGVPTLVEENGSWVECYWFLQRKEEPRIKYVTWLPTENLIVRKSVFDKINGFNENLITCEDADFCYRLDKNFLIISDPDIASIHLGEAKDLKHFYTKEKWRGKGNLQGLFSHGIVWDELPSLLFPVYYLIAFFFLPVVAIWSFVIQSIIPLAIPFFIISGPLILLSLRVAFRSKHYLSFFPMVILYFVYALARTAAILPEKSNAG